MNSCVKLMGLDQPWKGQDAEELSVWSKLSLFWIQNPFHEIQNNQAVLIWPSRKFLLVLNINSESQKECIY